MQHMLPLLNTMEAAADTVQSSNRQQQKLMRTVSISVLVMSLPVLYVSFLHVPPAALFRDTTFWFLMSNSIIIVIAADSGMLFFGRSNDDHDGGLSFAAAVVKGDGRRHAPSPMGGSDEARVEAVEDQQALVVRDHSGHLAAAAIADAESDGRAYALVERGHRAVVTTPETRDIVVVVSPSATNVDAGPIVPATTTAPRLLTASRGLAERDERRATRRRRRHGHRPSHSQALVPVVQDKSVVVVSEEKERRHHLRRAATTTDRRAPPPPPEEEESEYSRLSDEELNRRVEEFIARFNREIRLQLEKEEQAATA